MPQQMILKMILILGPASKNTLLHKIKMMIYSILGRVVRMAQKKRINKINKKRNLLKAPILWIFCLLMHLLAVIKIKHKDKISSHLQIMRWISSIIIQHSLSLKVILIHLRLVVQINNNSNSSNNSKISKIKKIKSNKSPHSCQIHSPPK